MKTFRKPRIAIALAATILTLGTPSLANGPALAKGTETKAPPAAQQDTSSKPNVLVWMLDDVGFAQLSSFGGLVDTPNIDRVAKMGLRYTNYHTAPVCSAARASFLTGRMPHSVHIGNHAFTARPYPGYDANLPASAGTIAENLRQGGYVTFALGKWDHMPRTEMTLAGPFDHWPTGQGFDRFYGFLAADADNFTPTLVRDTSPAATPDKPDYHLNNDIADEAIAMIDARDAATPERPFFIYWATGTAHAPHHAPKHWIERYSGKFDMGWDKARETILASQIAEGMLPEGTALAPRPEGMAAWDTLSAEERRLYARQMEVFAGHLSHADEQFGRILDALEERGELDNTIIVITSDNGASAEGGTHGMFTEVLLGSGRQAGLAENMAFYDTWGGPETYPHYALGWAVAGNTPFRYYKQTVHEGGTRVPLVIAWPEGIASRGELRGQFAHVADVAPTILDAIGLPLAEVVNDVNQQPMEGVSLAYSFADADAPNAKKAQYFEMFGNKGLWADGWSIVTTHRTTPWDMTTNHPIDEPWELYDLRNDPGQTRDLAAEHPERVARMDALFREQAERYNVNPIGNIFEGVMTSYREGHEEFVRRGGVWRFAGPVSSIPGTAGPPITSRSFTMTAQLDLPEPGMTGPVFASGGRLSGMALYLRKGKPVFLLTSIEGKTLELEANGPLPVGRTSLTLDFTNTAKSNIHEVAIHVNGEPVARGKMQMALPSSFGIFESFGIGIDRGSAMLAGAMPDTPFPGTIGDIVFDFNGE